MILANFTYNYLSILEASYFWFPNHLPVFAAGISLHFILEEEKATNLYKYNNRYFWPLSFFTISLLILPLQNYSPYKHLTYVPFL
jgi:hypothetical protein